MKFVETREVTDKQMLYDLLAMWSLEGSGGYSNLGVVCPYCVGDKDEFEASYVHFSEPKFFPGNDNYGAKSVYGMGVRGSVIVLPFSCEEGGHEWVVVLGAHKGSIQCKIILTDDGKPFSSAIENLFWDAWHVINYAENCPINFELTSQHPLGKYRVDFAHIPTKTVIELDGFATHSSTDDIANDRKRQRDIEAMGWHVIRFGGKEITGRAFECASEVWDLLKKRSEVSA